MSFVHPSDRHPSETLHEWLERMEAEIDEHAPDDTPHYQIGELLSIAEAWADLVEPKGAISFRVDLPPSVNHAYRRMKRGSRITRELTPDAQAWKIEAGLVARLERGRRGFEIVADEKVVVELTAFYPDKRRRDIHNLHKLICDAFEGELYTDDRLVLVRDQDFTVDRDDPRLEVRVYPIEGSHRDNV
jgi:crossover junction endodeoxyribonuclease RusA